MTDGERRQSGCRAAGVPAEVTRRFLCLHLPHLAPQDGAALARLADWALRFSPVVQPVEPDTLWLEITGCAHLFRGEVNLARQALGGLMQQGFEARAAVADTPGGAHALAICGRALLTIAPPGQTSAALAPLPAAALRLDPRAVEQLDLVGVRTVGDLLMLPRAGLRSRFGDALVQRLHQALGEVFEGVRPHRSIEPPHAGAGFENPLRELPPLEQVADHLLREVAIQAEQYGVGLWRLDAFIYYDLHLPDPSSPYALPPSAASAAGPAPRVERIALARASRAWPHIRRLLNQRLERVDLGPGVIGVRLIASRTARWRPEQIELDFESTAEIAAEAHAAASIRTPQADTGPVGTGAAANALAILMDTLANRLGHAAVVRPRLRDDYQPEYAYGYVPVVQAGLAAEVRVSDTGGDPPPRAYDCSDAQDAGVEGGPGRAAQRVPYAPRPLRLLARPMPVRAVAIFPDGPPTWFEVRGVSHRVRHAAGPERIETAWWRGPDVRRDYFRITSETGAQFWLFRDALKRQWYLHGLFV